MPDRNAYYENMDMMDPCLPVLFHKDRLSWEKRPHEFRSHWHEAIELLFVTEGELGILCNANEFAVKAGDLVVVNSNEIHQGRGLTGVAEYYCIIFNTSLLGGHPKDACNEKYIRPIMQNRILFMNKIAQDKEAAECIGQFIQEFEAKEIGYEMAVKASLYNLIVLLLRKYTQSVLTPKEYDVRMKNLKRFHAVLEFMETHYNERITLDQLCSVANISSFYFSRRFKEVIGKSPMDYLNALRVDKAEALLRNNDVNITEAALACGFDDLNYFSRVFRKYKKVSPSSIMKR